MELIGEIKRISQEKLSPAQFIVDVIVSAGKNPRKISVFADGDQGFSIDDCAELSRFLAKYLDDHNLIDDSYLLEVSTPGIDHPLQLKRQYVKNVGRGLKVKTKTGTLEGKLIEVADDKIVLGKETGSGKKKEIVRQEIALADIEKALVQISFK
jgi:ribosome maturation factor RimP